MSNPIRELLATNNFKGKGKPGVFKTVALGKTTTPQGRATIPKKYKHQKLNLIDV